MDNKENTKRKKKAKLDRRCFFPLEEYGKNKHIIQNEVNRAATTNTHKAEDVARRSGQNQCEKNAVKTKQQMES